MWVPCEIFLERLCLMSGAWHAGNTVIENQSMVLKKFIVIYLYIYIYMWPYYYIWPNYYIKSYSPTYKYIYFKVADFSHPKLKNQKT